MSAPYRSNNTFKVFMISPKVEEFEGDYPSVEIHTCSDTMGQWSDAPGEGRRPQKMGRKLFS